MVFYNTTLRASLEIRNMLILHENFAISLSKCIEVVEYTIDEDIKSDDVALVAELLWHHFAWIHKIVRI
jgi:hypothetical protein